MHGLLNYNYAAWNGYAALILRVATGLVFAMHGYQKLTQMGVDGVAGFLGGLGFPMASVFAMILIAAELLGGIALILGLWTRISAKLLAIVAIIAWLTVHATKGFFASSGGFEFIMLIFAATISILITGPGVYALDNMLSRRGAGSQSQM